MVHGSLSFNFIHISPYSPVVHMQNEPVPDSNMLLTLVTMRMPFGRYKGTILCNLPVSYLEWFAREGFPPGQMGMLLATIYEIKINGLEDLLKPLKKSQPGYQ